MSSGYVFASRRLAMNALRCRMQKDPGLGVGGVTPIGGSTVSESQPHALVKVTIRHLGEIQSDVT